MARRSRVPDLSSRCGRCLFPPAFCLCAEVRPVETRTRLVFLRHASEIGRPTNTVRWAALALRGAEVVEYGLPGARLDDRVLRGEGTWVLFPSARPSPPPRVPPGRLVVLDGSWAQARRMLQRVPALRALPRLSLSAPAPRPRLRRPTVAGGMSTLEALAAALALLGEPQAAHRLEALHAAALDRAARLRYGRGA